MKAEEERVFDTKKSLIYFKGVTIWMESPEPIMQILKAGVLYSALVFGAGFLLGPIRIFWAAPQFGTRMAELMESPIMFVVIIIAARWIVRRFAVLSTPLSRLFIGAFALGLLLFAEFTLVLWLQSMSIAEYLANRDPLTGTIYYVMLGLFAIMPWFLAIARSFSRSGEGGL